MRDTLSAHELFGTSVVDFETLQGADDDKLLRLVAAYKRDKIENMEELSSEAMATLMLRKRGYEIHRDSSDSVIFETPEGEQLPLADI